MTDPLPRLRSQPITQRLVPSEPGEATVHWGPHLRPARCPPSCREVILSATPDAPEYVLRAAAEFPQKVRILGFVGHGLALRLQRDCDVLVNLANEDPVQVPGKVNEYLGSGRPILHVGGTESDATGRLIERLHAGWHVRQDREEIRNLLHELRSRLFGGLGNGQRDEDAIAAYSWQRLAAGWLDRIRSLPRKSMAPMSAAGQGTRGGMG